MPADYFSWVFWPEHQFLLNLLGQARFVGGSVRNSLLQCPVDDFDLATPHHPEHVMVLLSKSGLKPLPTGLNHGTVSVALKGRFYEVTTLRVDVQTDGRHAQIAFTDSWQEDAARRDFTMNALFVDNFGKIYDYFDGLKDLQQQRVRFIGIPEKRIHEDTLRILRFFRMQAYYGGVWDRPSLEAACALKQTMAPLSGERITKELLKLLQAKDPWPVLQKMFDHDFWPWILQPLEGPNILALGSLCESILKINFSPLVRLLFLGLPPYGRLVLSRAQKNFLTKASQPIRLLKQNVSENIYRQGVDLTQARILLSWVFSDMKNTDLLRDLWFQTLISDYPAFPITGHDLCQRGLRGQKISTILDQVLSWWIAENYPDRKTCLDYLDHFLQD